jgi:hypothetical protein
MGAFDPPQTLRHVRFVEAELSLLVLDCRGIQVRPGDPPRFLTSAAFQDEVSLLPVAHKVIEPHVGQYPAVTSRCRSNSVPSLEYKTASRSVPPGRNDTTIVALARVALCDRESFPNDQEYSPPVSATCLTAQWAVAVSNPRSSARRSNAEARTVKVAWNCSSGLINRYAPASKPRTVNMPTRSACQYSRSAVCSSSNRKLTTSFVQSSSESDLGRKHLKMFSTCSQLSIKHFASVRSFVDGLICTSLSGIGKVEPGMSGFGKPT